MKFLLALSAVLAINTATAEWTCDDCNAVVNTLGAYLSSGESIPNQVDILLAEVCPQVEDVDGCVNGLPAFWTKIANVLWPGYYAPEATWMCAQEGLCGAPATRTITCEECNEGIMATIEQINSEEFVSGIVDALSGDGFCGTVEDPELCATTIAVLIPLALPALAGAFDAEGGAIICNRAIPDTCPALY
eukprot:GFUD01012837.1.p1 GENE.GFUD01012837.1~~GFUD01012837.1.p1  ORF type:complete len:190 (-),score=42.54 GFUD01012837.1:96-665(-)